MVIRLLNIPSNTSDLLTNNLKTVSPPKPKDSTQGDNEMFAPAKHVNGEATEKYRRTSHVSHFAHLWATPPANGNGNDQAFAESLAPEPIATENFAAEALVANPVVNSASVAGSSSHFETPGNTFHGRQAPVAGSSSHFATPDNKFQERQAAVFARFKATDNPTAAVVAQSRQVIELPKVGQSLNGLSPRVDLYAEFRAAYLGYTSNYSDFAGHLLHAINHCPPDVKYDQWVFVAVNFPIARRQTFNLKFDDWIRCVGVAETQHEVLTRDKVLETMQNDEALTFVLMARMEF